LVPHVIRIVMVLEELRFLDNTRTYPKATILFLETRDSTRDQSGE